MKIIEILNKIANGEIETFYKFKYRNKIVTMGYLLDNYLFLEILNDEIEFIEDTSKEEKKIPEKIPLNYADDRKPEEVYEYLRCSYNQLIDYLKSKGDE